MRGVSNKDDARVLAVHPSAEAWYEQGKADFDRVSCGKQGNRIFRATRRWPFSLLNLRIRPCKQG